MADQTRHTSTGHPHIPVETMVSTVLDDGFRRAPTQQGRPLLGGRQYSAHVYALNTPAAEHYGLEPAIQRPQRAHVTRSESLSWPMQSVITVGPSDSLRRSESFVSQDSTGNSVHEVSSPPRQLLDRVEACGPGTYRSIVTDVKGQTRSLISDSTKSLDDTHRADVVTFHLQRADMYDHVIASGPYLQRLCSVYPLPKLESSQRWLQLRYVTLSTYRRIFAVVLIANIVAIGCMIPKCVREPGSFTFADATTAVSANLFLAILIRNEHCVNLIFRMCVALPLWLPVPVRRCAAKVYSYGGIHSACGFSAFLWYIFFTVLLFQKFQASDAVLNAVAALTGLVDLLMLVMIVWSHPQLRSKYHDTWELSHRYLGWVTVAAVWVQLGLIFASQASRQERNAGVIAIESPSFWFLLGITAMIVYPWLRLRRVKVDVEKLSDHAARLRFTNHQRRMTACVGTKISMQPLLDNHSFATIADPGGEKGYSMLVSNAGDFTNKIVNNPPEYLWKRGAPVIGVMRLAQLFKPIVVVATGSGIGPCMSFLQTHPGWPCRIVWSTRMPEASYGVQMIEAILAADKDALIIDTHKTGYGDIVAVAYAVYRESKAEAVVTISNPRVSKKVTYGLEQRNVPAFAPIFDS